MGRTLCARCLTSVDDTLLAEDGGQRVCPACASASGRRPAAQPQAASPAPALMDLERTFAQRLVEDMRDWCTGRSWWLRAPVLVYLAFVGFRYAIQPLQPDPTDLYVSWFDGINLGFHELGHMLFRAFGRFLHILGGTLLQCIMPALAGFFMLRWRDYFGVAFCIGWFSTNISGVAIYLGDAQLTQLPLVAPGFGRVDASFHDWRNLLTTMGLLEHTNLLASVLKIAAVLTMAFALAFGSWLCVTMVRSPGKVRF